MTRVNEIGNILIYQYDLDTNRGLMVAQQVRIWYFDLLNIKSLVAFNYNA